MVAERTLQNLDEAEHAYNRVREEMEGLKFEELALVNVDLMNATSTASGVSDEILTFRERLAKLPEFQVRCVDNLVDYINATWYVYVTNQPVPEPEEEAAMIAEVTELRTKLLRWAGPLSDERKLDANALKRIREGTGNQDTASDVVALVTLYRGNWGKIQGSCSVTEEDLNRGAKIGLAMFGLVSRRARGSGAKASGSLRVRRAWTLLDRAYTECRRGIQYLRFYEGDADIIAPSLRKNSGPRAGKESDEPVEEAEGETPSDSASPSSDASSGNASASSGSGSGPSSSAGSGTFPALGTGRGIGSGDSPFIK